MASSGRRPTARDLSDRAGHPSCRGRHRRTRPLIATERRTLGECDHPVGVLTGSGVPGTNGASGPRWHVAGCTLSPRSRDRLRGSGRSRLVRRRARPGRSRRSPTGSRNPGGWRWRRILRAASRIFSNTRYDSAEVWPPRANASSASRTCRRIGVGLGVHGHASPASLAARITRTAISRDWRQAPWRSLSLAWFATVPLVSSRNVP